MPTQQKVIVIFGYGPGISSSVATKFGSQGFSVALVARNKQRLEAGVTALKEKGIDAAAFPADAGDPAAVTAAVEGARKVLGPIQAILWNAYALSAGDLTTADSNEVRATLDVPVVGLLAAVQAALPDLKQAKDAAILVTNGGLGLLEDSVDTMAIQWNAMGLALANAAKQKLVRLLAKKLNPDGIYVGEVVVMGTVKGTAFDSGSATLDANAIAEKFWTLYTARSETSVRLG